MTRSSECDTFPKVDARPKLGGSAPWIAESSFPEWRRMRRSMACSVHGSVVSMTCIVFGNTPSHCGPPPPEIRAADGNAERRALASLSFAECLHVSITATTHCSF